MCQGILNDNLSSISSRASPKRTESVSCIEKKNDLTLFRREIIFIPCVTVHQICFVLCNLDTK